MLRLATLLLATCTVLSGCVAYETYPDTRAQAHHGYRDNYGSRDRDRDGIPNRYDRDRDGDGVANNRDRYPDNPRWY